MHERETQLAEAPIKKLLWKLSAPAMVGMLVMALYNLVDTIFIGRAVGILGIAGIAIVFPIHMLIMAIEQTIGIGGASFISRKLGERKKEETEFALGNIVSMVIISSIIMTVLGLVFIKPLLIAFGATDTILPLAIEYARIIMLGIVFFSFGMVGNNLVRAEGNAKVAMITMLIGALLNIILDPIFIFGFGMGMAGAAWATVLSQIATFLYILYYFATGKSLLKFYFKNLRLKFYIVKEITVIGISSFVRMGSSSIMAMVLNNSLAVYGGDIAIGVFGIINRLLAFVFLPLIGIVQGMQPIVGYNFGSGAMDRVKEAIKLSIKLTTYSAIGAFLVLEIFPKSLLQIFTSDPDAIEMGVLAMRVVALAFATIGFQVVSGGLYQALGRAKESLFLSSLRQVLLLIPLVIILPHFFGLLGIWIAFPVADSLAGAITWWMYRREMRILN
ncbi:MAG: MATE family efflux transporter [Candidatus Magasanikbacteria bacterium]|jgi:putative MATE family efflux protein|nr:MATE family efflux transporter [Candidatus Magasanikbacteria bacterium]MBT4315123.1 MATE family efflux transporter [Candidatus Magasanikbacteria bacterium]MBT4547421.1 MATE family efflux transporter [Candidatus Magasanikbacteria bacterium]MBT6819338.1 MATE family efflux transporter [Candidatus Magasanikbacteria bacterium]